MTRTALIAAAFSVVSLVASPSAAAANRSPVLGARVSCDVPGSSAETGACPGVEVFGHFPLKPTVTLDASLGYRRESYWSGSHSATPWRLTQYPLLLGVSYVPLPQASVRPFLAAGLLVAPSTASYGTPSRYRGAVSDSTTSLTFGGFGSVGLRALLGRALRLEGEVRYVFNPLHASAYVQADEKYAVVLLGLGHTF